jgi:hypothetical protein
MNDTPKDHELTPDQEATVDKFLAALNGGSTSIELTEDDKAQVRAHVVRQLTAKPPITDRIAAPVARFALLLLFVAAIVRLIVWILSGIEVA